MAITALMAARWGIINNSVRGIPTKRASWFEYYHYTITGRLLGLFLPKDLSAIFAKSAWLKVRHQQRVTETGVSAILDRLFDLLMATIMLAAVLPFWLGIIAPRETVATMAGLCVCVLLLSLYQGPKMLTLCNMALRKFSWLLHRLPIEKGNYHDMAIQPQQVKHHLFAKLFLISLAKFCLTSARLALFSAALGLAIPGHVILFSTPVGQFSYLFAFTPGGLGIFEAGLFGALTLSGTQQGIATLFILGQRVFTTVFIVILATVSQLVFLARKRGNSSSRFG